MYMYILMRYLSILYYNIHKPIDSAPQTIYPQYPIHDLQPPLWKQTQILSIISIFFLIFNFWLIIILFMSLLDKRTKIWKEGETTNPFVCPEMSFNRSRRFKLYSIYWPEKNQSKSLNKDTRSPVQLQACKISKLIDEEEKNQSRMNRMTMPMLKVQDGLTNRSQPKNGFSSFKPTSTSSLSKQNQKIVERLTSSSLMKQSKLRDRHGNRTNLVQNQEDDVFYGTLREENKFRGTQRGFYTSRRINLNLPHNYYPGPGTYDIKRYLQELKANKIFPRKSRHN